MKPDKKNLFLAFSIIIFLISIFIFSFNGINKILTGYASDTAQTSLDVVSQASIEFVINSTGWSSGAVSPGNLSAYLNTEGLIDGGNWTANTQSLYLVNTGNSNLTVDLKSNNSASEFIGGDSVTPEYKIKVSNNESGSCTISNFSDYDDLDTSDKLACSVFQYNNSKDSIAIDVQLRIPQDALPGNKTSLITATGVVI
jgi:hypothetical protein